MSLFAPSFVTPSDQWGIGNGVVDVWKGMTVSWQVNGDSPMTAYDISIYNRDTESTLVYSTGQVDLSTPFYGTDGAGNAQTFSVDIPSATLRNAGMSNGNEYKMTITQYWGSGQGVTMPSAAAFITRGTPVVTVTVPATVETRYVDFSATLAQSENEPASIVRWQVALSSDTANPIFDTGSIYTGQLAYRYDGLLSSATYAVRCIVQTQSGMTAESGWVTFTAQYPVVEATGYANACCAAGKNGVLVEWGRVGQIPGIPTGNYSIASGNLELPVGSRITWNTVSSEPMDFDPPWTFLWRGTVKTFNATLFTLRQATGGNISVDYRYSDGRVRLLKGNTVLASTTGAINWPKLTIIITPDTFYVRADYVDNALFPSTTLVPTQWLYPSAGGTATYALYSEAVSYTQYPVTQVQVFGPGANPEPYYTPEIQVDFIELYNGVAPQELIDEAYTYGTYVPEMSAVDYLMATFTDGLDAGNVTIDDGEIIGYSLYRQQGDSQTLVHVADTGTDVRSIVDYGAASQQGPYTYYLFLLGSSTYLAQPFVSTPINPTWWDWSIIECDPQDVNGVYTALAEYRFGKNLKSGDMSNNNQPSVLQNFTRYPTVQYAPQNYKSGALTSLIGSVDAETGEYSDSLATRDAIFALPSSGNALFLKSRKGDVIRIAASGPVSMQTMDESRSQAQTVTFPWIEVNGMENVSIYAIERTGA